MPAAIPHKHQVKAVVHRDILGVSRTSVIRARASVIRPSVSVRIFSPVHCC